MGNYERRTKWGEIKHVDGHGYKWHCRGCQTKGNWEPTMQAAITQVVAHNKSDDHLHGVRGTAGKTQGGQ